MPSKLEIILWIAVAASLTGAAWKINEWHKDAQTLKVERVEHAAVVVRLNDRIKQEIENAKKADDAATGFQNRLDALEAGRLSTPVRSVSLCVPGTAPARLPVSATPIDPANSGPVELPDHAGSDFVPSRDIGADLYALADAADRCAAQRDALIKWIKNR